MALVNLFELPKEFWFTLVVSAKTCDFITKLTRSNRVTRQDLAELCILQHFGTTSDGCWQVLANPLQDGRCEVASAASI